MTAHAAAPEWAILAISGPDRLAVLRVQVSDIKRANGMLADNAMFGKDTLLIPTRPLPVG